MVAIGLVVVMVVVVVLVVVILVLLPPSNQGLPNLANTYLRTMVISSSFYFLLLLLLLLLLPLPPLPPPLPLLLSCGCHGREEDIGEFLGHDDELIEGDDTIPVLISLGHDGLGFPRHLGVMIIIRIRRIRIIIIRIRIRIIRLLLLITTMEEVLLGALVFLYFSLPSCWSFSSS